MSDELADRMQKLSEKFRDRGGMVLDDDLLDGCHPYGRALVDAADAIDAELKAEVENAE